MKTSEEFVVGKHNIGWIDSDFKKRFGGLSFEKGKTVPSVIILPRIMTGIEIKNEYGLTTLGDVLAYMDSGSEAWMAFCVEAKEEVFVVRVAWRGDEWLVHAWPLDDRWNAGLQFGSRNIPSALGTSDTTLTLESLDARLKKLEDWRKG